LILPSSLFLLEPVMSGWQHARTYNIVVNEISVAD